jgi:hypothetical protein
LSLPQNNDLNLPFSPLTPSRPLSPS